MEQKNNPLGTHTFFQVGIVVPDLDAAADKVCELFGFEKKTPWGCGAVAYDGHETLYHGRPVDGNAKVVSYDFGSLEIEFMEPMEGGPSVWKDYMDEHGAGIHHVAVKVYDTEEAKAYLTGKGYPVIQQGKWDGGVYTYFDCTEDMGFILETAEMDKERKAGKPFVPHWYEDANAPTQLNDPNLMDTRCVWQIGIVVKDAQAVSNKIQEVFGFEQAVQAGPAAGSAYDKSNTVYRGKSIGGFLTGAFYDFGSVELEIMEPVAGEEDIWNEYLEKHGAGIHHVAWKVYDTEKTAELLAKKGYQKIQQARWETGCYVYYDLTDPVGMVLETLEFDDERLAQNPLVDKFYQRA